MPKFNVWARDLEQEEHADEHEAASADDAAHDYAEHAHDHHELHDCTWPIVFCVKDEEGKTFIVEVDRDFEPTFMASDAFPLADFAPVLHVTEGEHGPALCRDIRLPPSQRDWPHGHRSMAFDKVPSPDKLDPSPSVCATCVERYKSRVQFLADVEERRKKIEAERQ